MEIKPILEALLFVHPHPLSVEELRKAFPEWRKEEIEGALRELTEEYEKMGRAFHLVEVAGGYQFRTRPEYASWIKRLRKVRPMKLSRAALEALAVVAYRQPVTRAEVEEIRGVDSGWVLGSLLEKGLIHPIGRKETVGRPLLYGTTKKFLETFGLKDLKDLPTLKEIEALTEEEG